MKKAIVKPAPAKAAVLDEKSSGFVGIIYVGRDYYEERLATGKVVVREEKLFNPYRRI